MVPKLVPHVTGYKSHECQRCISGICQHQFCPLEQRTTRELFLVTNRARGKDLALAFLCATEEQWVPFHPLYSPAEPHLSNQKRFSSYLAMPHMGHGPPGEAVVICLVKMQGNVWIFLSFSCSARKVNAAVASAVIPSL